MGLGGPPAPHRARHWPPAAALATLLSARPAGGKFVAGSVALGPKQAQVVTKFCFDYDATCERSRDCTEGTSPGLAHFTFYRDDAAAASAFGKQQPLPPPDVHLALLDDEYFSFPEVSQVWSEANCSDILRAAKRSFKLDWQKVANKSANDTIQIETRVVEKIRPRWWYVAIASCSNYSLDLSYRFHLENKQRGWQSELSMDHMGVFALTFWACASFCGLLAAQIRTMSEWASKSQTRRWLRLHPALLLLTWSTLLSAAGEAFWLAYYWYFTQFGEASELWALAGRAAIISAKVLMQILLMLLAHGECVCTPDIVWSARLELVVGQAFFGCLTFGLEVWGDTEHQSTTVEYIYDTRPGMILVAFDALWLYMFASRSWQTMEAETRLKPKRFYRRYGPVFGLWFATLPVVAALATLIAAWVRYRAVLAMNLLMHAMALGALIYTFRPEVAERLYELSAHEYAAVHGDEMLADMASAGKDDDHDDEL